MSWLASVDSSTGWILGWTIIHSLWQGALVAAGLSLVLRFVPVAMVRVRAALAWGAFAFVLLAASATGTIVAAEWRGHAACWSSTDYARDNTALCAGHAVPAAREALDRSDQAASSQLVARPPIAVAARAVFLSSTRGVAIAAVAAAVLAFLAMARLFIGVGLLNRILRRARSPVDGEIQGLLRRLRRELRVDVPVRIRVSADVSTPAVAGWRRPTILVPQDLADLLGPAQLTDVIAHELAHVRGRHFPVNLGQCALDCLCVFNPFALWISGQIREEREARCDRIAAGPLRGAHRRYAQTLLQLETLRAPAAPLLVGLIGDGSLLRRVRRLLEPATQQQTTRLRNTALAFIASLSTIALVALFSITIASLTSWAVMSRDIQVRTAATAPATVPATTPSTAPATAPSTAPTPTLTRPR